LLIRSIDSPLAYWPAMVRQRLAAGSPDALEDRQLVLSRFAKADAMQILGVARNERHQLLLGQGTP
jgi:hypothetical protein